MKYRDDITAGSLKLPESRLLADLLLLLVNLHLRTHVSDRRKFFDAKDRLQKIKNLVAPDDAAADLDRKMIAVVAKADQPELFNIVRTVLHAFATDEHGKNTERKSNEQSSSVFVCGRNGLRFSTYSVGPGGKV